MSPNRPNIDSKSTAMDTYLSLCRLIFDQNENRLRSLLCIQLGTELAKKSSYAIYCPFKVGQVNARNEIPVQYVCFESSSVGTVLYFKSHFYGPFSSLSVLLYIRNSKTAELSTDFKLKVLCGGRC